MEWYDTGNCLCFGWLREDSGGGVDDMIKSKGWV